MSASEASPRSVPVAAASSPTWPAAPRTGRRARREVEARRRPDGSRLGSRGRRGETGELARGFRLLVLRLAADPEEVRAELQRLFAREWRRRGRRPAGVAVDQHEVVRRGLRGECVRQLEAELRHPLQERGVAREARRDVGQHALRVVDEAEGDERVDLVERAPQLGGHFAAPPPAPPGSEPRAVPEPAPRAWPGVMPNAGRRWTGRARSPPRPAPARRSWRRSDRSQRHRPASPRR